jgi:hypothetical protein
MMMAIGSNQKRTMKKIVKEKGMGPMLVLRILKPQT